MSARIFPQQLLPPMVSYAQNFEDVALRRALPDITAGFWIDIGAYHPTFHSVTKWFSDQGWSGVNVEPNPDFLRQLTKARPHDINIGAAVGSGPGTIDFNIIGDTGLSTALPALVEIQAKNGHRVTETIRVPVVTLDSLMASYAANREIDFLKIDAEGFESAILSASAFTIRPRILLIEDGPSFHDHLVAHDYLFVWFDGINRFYVRSEDEWRGELLARPPSIFDNFTFPDPL